jgi:hypothetical protein
MTGILLPSRKTTRLRASLFVLLVLPCLACGGEGPPSPNVGTVDTIIPPPGPPDTTGGDTIPAPPDTTGPVLPPVTPVHVGIPFGPSMNTKGASYQLLLPPSSYLPEFTGVLQTAYPQLFLASLEVLRRANGRVIISFTGNERWNRDDNGFNLAIWKQRVDRFRNIDFSSYIADGTIVGHFIMDEPNDPTNWNGHLVSLADIDEMARYSKEIWPSMATIIRGWPAYLKGYHYQYLDAAWAQYHKRFGDIDAFIASNVQDAKASGLALVGGLNLLNGGTGESGIPGHSEGKFAMGPTEIRSLGNRILAEPYICAFMMWQYDSLYFSRPEIQAAISDISKQATSHPERACRRGT